VAIPGQVSTEGVVLISCKVVQRRQDRPADTMIVNPFQSEAPGGKHRAARIRKRNREAPDGLIGSFPGGPHPPPDQVLLKQVVASVSVIARDR